MTTSFHLQLLHSLWKALTMIPFMFARYGIYWKHVGLSLSVEHALHQLFWILSTRWRYQLWLGSWSKLRNRIRKFRSALLSFVRFCLSFAYVSFFSWLRFHYSFSWILCRWNEGHKDGCRRGPSRQPVAPVQQQQTSIKTGRLGCLCFCGKNSLGILLLAKVLHLKKSFCISFTVKQCSNLFFFFSS